MLKIDFLAYNSSLCKVNPSQKLLFAFIPLVLCLVFSTFWLCIATFCTMTILCIVLGKINLKQYLKLLLVPLSFLLLGTVTIIFNQYPLSQELLLGFSVNGYKYGITNFSLSFGLLLVFKAIACVSCVYFISLNTPMNQLLTFLREIKLPAFFITLMELVYRFIFVVLEQSKKIKIAQNSRLGYSSFKNSLKSSGLLISSIFIKTQSRCDGIYNALASRGYEGEIKTLSKNYKTSNLLRILLIITNCSLLLIWFWESGI